MHWIFFSMGYFWTGIPLTHRRATLVSQNRGAYRVSALDLSTAGREGCQIDLQLRTRGKLSTGPAPLGRARSGARANATEVLVAAACKSVLLLQRERWPNVTPDTRIWKVEVW